MACAAPPVCRRAVRVGSPRRCESSAASSMCSRNSSRRSASFRPRSEPTSRCSHSRRLRIRVLLLFAIAPLRSGVAAQQRLHDRSHAIPGLLLSGQLAPASRRQRVEPRLAIGVSGAPVPLHEPALLEPHQTGIQRAHVETQRSARHLLEPRCDRVPVLRAHRVQGLQYHQVERTLQHIGLGRLSISHANGVSQLAFERQMKSSDIHIEEGPLGPPPIDGVNTSTAGMAGIAERGPAEPQLITSWREYQNLFGGFVDDAFLPAAVQGFFDNGGRRVYVARASDARTGLAALESIDDISLLLAPDEVTDSTGAISAAVIDQCERRRDRFAIVSARRSADRIQDLRPPRDSAFAAFYCPWFRVLDPVRQKSVMVPPAGHIAGIYARTDIERGIHKPPANADVRGLTTGAAGSSEEPLKFTATDAQHDNLNQ